MKTSLTGFAALLALMIAGCASDDTPPETGSANGEVATADRLTKVEGGAEVMPAPTDHEFGKLVTLVEIDDEYITVDVGDEEKQYVVGDWIRVYARDEVGGVELLKTGDRLKMITQKTGNETDGWNEKIVRIGVEQAEEEDGGSISADIADEGELDNLDDVAAPEFAGTVVSVQQTAVTLDVDGNETSFALDDGVEVTKEGESGGVELLKEGDKVEMQGRREGDHADGVITVITKVVVQ